MGDLMKRVLLIVHDSLGKGGIQNVVMNTVRWLSDGFRFDALILNDDDGHYDAEFLSYGGKIKKIGFNTKKCTFRKRLVYYTRGYYIYKTVRTIISENGPYVAVHCHIADEAGIALLAAKKCHVPVRIAHAHTAFDHKYNPIARLYTGYLKKLIRKNATNMVACSQKAGEKLFGENKFSVIYNTVDKRFWDCEYQREVHDAPYLIQVGMICDNKNQAFSLDVLKCLKERYPDAKLTFIGASKDADMERYLVKLQTKVRDFKLCDSVAFLPADSDVKAEMQRADFLVLPSLYEGLGIAAIEAQALGLKCFVSSGVPYEADCGGCVFLSLDSGVEAWAERIAEHFGADRGARQKYDMYRFAPDVIMDQYRRLYRGEIN